MAMAEIVASAADAKSKLHSLTVEIDATIDGSD